MALIREVRPAGHWPITKEVDRITLPYDQRHRRRLRLIADAGTEVLLDLPAVRLLREGDGLKLPSGAYIHVHAAPEELVEVTAPSSAMLVRLAWHIGNRHLPADLVSDSDVPERILIRRDHVIEEMLLGLGARLQPVEAPFNPESGAYDGVARHLHGPHDHHHDHDHDHDHDDDRGLGHGDHDHMLGENPRGARDLAVTPPNSASRKARHSRAPHGGT